MFTISVYILATANLLYGYIPTPGMKNINSKIESSFKADIGNGNADSQTVAGIMYYKGLFGSADKKEAAKYFETACDKNNPVALYYLGEMYRDGEGVERDYKKACLLLKKAVSLEYYPSFYSLGTLYESGLGVDKNEKEASRLYLLAAQRGDEPAILQQGFLYEKNKEYKKAFQLFSSLKDKNINALLGVGRLYEAGNGVEKNYDLALKYYGQIKVIDPAIADIIYTSVTKQLIRKSNMANMLNQVKNNIKTGWLTYVSLALCIIFYYRSKKERLPYYNIVFDSVIDNSGKNNNPIRILYNNDEISNLIKAEMTFWNSGKETIRKEDIAGADPLKIKFKKGKILDVSLKKSNPQNNVEYSVGESKDTIDLVFDYLDKNDGLILEIFLDGPGDYQILGQIKGYGKPKFKNVVSPRDMKWFFFNNFMAPLIVLGMVGYSIYSNFDGIMPNRFAVSFLVSVSIASALAILYGAKNLLNFLPKSLWTR